MTDDWPKYQKCSGEQIWDGDRNVCIPRTDREMVGDGKLPNKYFVSFSNAELICKKGICDWDERIKLMGGTVAVFESFEGAMKFMDGAEMEDYVRAGGDGFFVTNKTIEDRFSGELANETVENRTRMVEERRSEMHKDTRFTEERMKELGVEFR